MEERVEKGKKRGGRVKKKKGEGEGGGKEGDRRNLSLFIY